MNITKINNVTFGAIYPAPGFHHITDEQREITTEIRNKLVFDNKNKYKNFETPYNKITKKGIDVIFDKGRTSKEVGVRLLRVKPKWWQDDYNIEVGSYTKDTARYVPLDIKRKVGNKHFVRDAVITIGVIAASIILGSLYGSKGTLPARENLKKKIEIPVKYTVNSDRNIFTAKL